MSGLRAMVRLALAVLRHPANRERRVASLYALLAWQFEKHVLGRARIVPFHGRQLKCYPDSPSTSAVIYFSGLPDYWEMKFLAAYLRPGDNFIDVGANAGVYSVFASAHVGLFGSIDAFEPSAASAARAEEQASLNGLARMRVHRLAVTDRTGAFDFGYAQNDAMMHLRRTGETGTSAGRVEGIRLDDFEPYLDYAAGKMDIEGAEPMALAGAARRLAAANPPVWLLELAGYSRYYGVESHEIVARLAQAGFGCAVFDPATGRLRHTQEPWTLNVQNVLAIAHGARAFVDARLAQAAETAS